MFPQVDENGKCEVCGHVLQIGDYPQCPHQNVKEGGQSAFFQDSIPGGVVIENGVPHPTRVYSYSEMDALRAQGGYRRKEKWCPTPGTDVDPAGVQNPERYQDAKTLQNGAALIMRQAGTTQAEIDADISKLFIPFTEADMPASPRQFAKDTGEYVECSNCGGSTVTLDGHDCPFCRDTAGLVLKESVHG